MSTPRITTNICPTCNARGPMCPKLESAMTQWNQRKPAERKDEVKLPEVGLSLASDPELQNVGKVKWGDCFASWQEAFKKAATEDNWDYLLNGEWVNRTYKALPMLTDSHDVYRLKPKAETVVMTDLRITPAGVKELESCKCKTDDKLADRITHLEKVFSEMAENNLLRYRRLDQLEKLARDLSAALAHFHNKD